MSTHEISPLQAKAKALTHPREVVSEILKLERRMKRPNGGHLKDVRDIYLARLREVDPEVSRHWFQRQSPVNRDIPKCKDVTALRALLRVLGDKPRAVRRLREFVTDQIEVLSRFAAVKKEGSAAPFISASTWSAFDSKPGGDR